MADLVKNDRPAYGILSILMIGTFIAFLNNTLLNIALPSIMKDLQINTATVQWLTTGFMLVNGIMIPTTAFLIEKYSVRRLFLSAMGIFVIGTLIAGSAHIFPFLLAGRMTQAVGAAIMMPLLMNVLLITFPVERRGTAMGVFGLILMFAPAIGPTLSGWIVEHYNWRMLFHLIAPIAIAVFLLGFFLLKDQKEKSDAKIDKLSLVLSSIGFGSLLYGFSSAGNYGWGSVHVYLPIPIGILVLTWFIFRQLRHSRPMLNFRVFQYPMFSLASAITMMVNMAMFSGFLLLPIYMQQILGISPMNAGLVLLPGALLNAAMSPLTGKLFDKYGGRMLAITGLILTTITTYSFSKLSMETTTTQLVILHALRMAGMSMVMMPVSTNGLNQLPKRLYPHGTAMNNTMNQIAAAIGTGFLITVMTTRTEVYTARMIAELGATPTEAVRQQIAMKAMLGGINDTFLLASGLTILALVLAFFIKRAKQEETDDAKLAKKEMKLKESY